MKQQLLLQWTKLSTKLDSMTLRERALVFISITAALLFMIYTAAVEPMLLKQTLLQAEIKRQQNQVTGIDLEIGAKAQAFVLDPDAATRARLQATRAEIERISAGLLAVQKGLVAPEKIAPLLDQLLRGNGKLRLVSMKTLPVAGMSDSATPSAPPVPAAPAPSAAPAPQALAAVVAAAAAANPGPVAKPEPAPVAKPRELLFRHGVEIVLQGAYLDMVDYMAALEGLPVQLFWGKASLDAQQYPDARLTLTLYTLSLDTKWMKL